MLKVKKVDLYEGSACVRVKFVEGTNHNKAL